MVTISQPRVPEGVTLPTKVAVYGTLRRRQGAHSILGNSRYLGSFMVQGFGMITYGAYPYAVPMWSAGDPVSFIHAEVYEVRSPEVMRNLDRLEGYPNHYNRLQVATPFGSGGSGITDDNAAWMYCLESTMADERDAMHSTSGGWMDYASLPRGELNA